VLIFALIMFGFCLATVALAGLSLYITSYEKKVVEFCEAAEQRFRPGFYQELEARAAKQIENLAKDSLKK